MPSSHIKRAAAPSSYGRRQSDPRTFSDIGTAYFAKQEYLIAFPVAAGQLLDPGAALDPRRRLAKGRTVACAQ